MLRPDCSPPHTDCPWSRRRSVDGCIPTTRTRWRPRSRDRRCGAWPSDESELVPSWVHIDRCKRRRRTSARASDRSGRGIHEPYRTRAIAVVDRDDRACREQEKCRRWEWRDDRWMQRAGLSRKESESEGSRGRGRLTDTARGGAKLGSRENDETEKTARDTEDEPDGVNVSNELLLNCK